MISISEHITGATPFILAQKKSWMIASSFMTKPDIYHKMFSFNELLGTKLARLRDIRTTEYFLLKLIDEGKNIDHDIKIGSYDFKKEQCQYLSPDQYERTYSSDVFRNLLNFCPTEENKQELVSEVIEMFGLDTYMMQKDRGFQNVTVEASPNSDLHLSPIYDYSMSFRPWDQTKPLYNNVLHSLTYYDDYWEYMEQYPQLKESLQFYQKIDLIDVIEDICDEQNLAFSDKIYDNYKEREEESQERLFKILV